MTKKIYNCLLILFILLAIVVIVFIVIKYGSNRVNENEIKAVISEVEESLQKSENVDKEYKGYKIEGIIEIPKINIKYPILCETSNETMKISVTKFWGPEINGLGNCTLAGHNNKDGTMFGKTKYLENGDIINLTDLYNNTVSYKIFKIYSIMPDDISCVESIENNTREVTLITCTNGHKNRLIIKAREINSFS